MVPGGIAILMGGDEGKARGSFRGRGIECGLMVCGLERNGGVLDEDSVSEVRTEYTDFSTHT